MGLDQDRVAGGEGGEQARVAVPRGEGVAADHQGDAPADRGELLAQLQGVALALGLGPVGPSGGGAGLLRVRVRHGLQAAVLGVRAACLERHHERLAAGVHDGVGELVGAGGDPGEYLQADQGARLGPGVPPGAHPRAHGGEQHVDVRVRVLDAQLRAVRRDLAAGPAVRAGLVQLEAAVQQGLVRGEAGRRVEGAVRPVGLRVLGVRRPVGAGADGVERLVERGPVLLGQTVGGRLGGGHGWTNSSSSWAGRHVRS